MAVSTRASMRLIAAPLPRRLVSCVAAMATPAPSPGRESGFPQDPGARRSESRRHPLFNLIVEPGLAQRKRPADARFRRTGHSISLAWQKPRRGIRVRIAAAQCSGLPEPAAEVAERALAPGT